MDLAREGTSVKRIHSTTEVAQEMKITMPSAAQEMKITMPSAAQEMKITMPSAAQDQSKNIADEFVDI